MFFDPGTKTETKADPLSLESLIAWLEKQPAEKVYCYMSHGHCLLAQYFEAIHGHPVWVGGITYNPHGTKPSRSNNVRMPTDFADIAAAIVSDTINQLFANQENTFGGALARARQIAAG